MPHRRFALFLLLIACTASCDALRFKKDKSSPSWTESKDLPSTTVPWKGEALAANTFIKIAQLANPAVVNVGTTKNVVQRGHPFFGMPQEDGSFGGDLFQWFFGTPDRRPQTRKVQSLGSGFLVNEDGYIVTNNHVIDQADEVTVTIGKDQEFKAKVVGTDPQTDVALLKVETKEKLPYLTMGDSDRLQVGEIVVAIGNPFGFSHTVTQGIVSATERSIRMGPYDSFIQTDASINPGNSGGPLLNLRAEVVGINSAIYSRTGGNEGIGFAIPVNMAKNIIDQLRTQGSVTRGWLGVYIQKVDPDLAKSLGLKDTRGSLVSSVQSDSPAAKAGIKRGDVILSYNGKDLENENDLPKFVAATPVGKEVPIVVLRGEKTLELKVKVGELKPETAKPDEEESESRSSAPDQLGLSVETLSARDRQQLDLDSETRGVIVKGVDPRGPAAQKGVQAGDVILEVNRQRISTASDYLKYTKSLNKGDSVLLLIKRGKNTTIYVAFTLD